MVGEEQDPFDLEEKNALSRTTGEEDADAIGLLHAVSGDVLLSSLSLAG